MEAVRAIDMTKVLEALSLTDMNPGASTGLNDMAGSGAKIDSYSPVDGELIGSSGSITREEYDAIVEKAHQGFLEFRTWTAPARGEVVRQVGEELRKYKEPLGQLVSYEMGKSLQEGYGEVQEMIDICDFAVGLSRQLHGLTTGRGTEVEHV